MSLNYFAMRKMLVQSAATLSYRVISQEKIYKERERKRDTEREREREGEEAH